MTLHAMHQLLMHKRKAMGRHGTHSPFVYGLIDTVLIPVYREKTLSDKIEQLAIGLDNYCRSTGYTTLGQGVQIIRLQDLPYSLPAVDNSADTVLLLSDIHPTTAHTNEWQKLCDDSSVTLSLDLYHAGILFFSPRFKQKQHFFLRF